MYDIAIIGGGVVGAMIAHSLARYRIKVCVLEKESDIATGASAANSGIVHAGFDAPTGTLKAKLNVRGSELMKELCRDLDVPYQNNGSLVLGFSDEDRKGLSELLSRGEKNGVCGLRILERGELFEREANLSPDVLCALFAPTGAIVCPYALTFAAMGNAMDNGVELFTEFEVTDICRIEDGFKVSSPKSAIFARRVINCAGVFADRIAHMAGDESFSIRPRRGEYLLLDKGTGALVHSTIFRLPGKMGKGILVTPTVDGNLLLGPTSENIDDPLDRSVTASGLDAVRLGAQKGVSGIPFSKVITSFCGLRATGSTKDFVINSPLLGFFNAAAIESPGLSAAPAIAEMMLSLLKADGLVFCPKEDYIATRKSPTAFRQMSPAEKNELIQADPSYGRIVCRCESVSEGEILAAIRQNPRPSTLDGIKRRTRAQMGRCQGGFCGPSIVELLSCERNIPYEEVTQRGGASYINVGKTKGVTE